MAASATPLLLILGSGPNIGHNVARLFAAKGYRIALVSRKMKEDDETSDQAAKFTGDLSDPDAVGGIFAKVRASVGIPSVVVYNAYAVTPNESSDPLSLPLKDFTRDLNTNTNSAFAAAQQAVRGFEELPASASRTFIYTGNILNTAVTIAPLLDLGVGKSATAHVIQSAATAYSDRGFKFYYADERKADGSPASSGIDGEAHAQLYWQLAQDQSQGPWQQTFVKGVGYKSFVA